MRRATWFAAGLLAVVVVALALTVVARTNRLAFTLGVSNGGPVAVVPPGERACQHGITVPEGGGFDRVRLSLGTYFRPGPPVSVAVAEPGGRVIARGDLPGGYPDIADAPSHSIAVGRVDEGSENLVVCVANEGDVKVAVYGNAGIASRSTSATVAGKEVDADLNLAFETGSRSVASLWPSIAERAALFRAELVGPWTYALLAGLVLLAVPALLVRALAAAERDE